MTCILLVTSNGTGMGHLTRQAAVALALRPEHEPTILTLSPAAPVVTRLGLRVEYCPSYDRPWVAATDWDWYLRDRVVAMVRELEAHAVVFDGVAPYQGIGMASRILPDVAFVWVRRGLWKPDVGSQHLARSSYFDLVIEPGDLAQKADKGPTTERADSVTVSPISMLEVVNTMSRDEAREALGLPKGPPIALVTLGSGMLGEIVGPGEVTIDTILGRPDWHVAVTRSSVATEAVPVGQSIRVHELRGVYPLVRYLKAFDAAVSSAGYNAVHELIPAGLPVVLVSNTSTRTDDQVLRARHLAQRGLAIAAKDSNLDAVREAVEELMKEDVRVRLGSEAAATLELVVGASDVARAVVEFVAGFDRATARSRIPSERLQFAKSIASRALGDRMVRWIRWILRRGIGRPGRRTKVCIGSRLGQVGGTLPLGIGNKLPSDLATRDTPFEHLLVGSSGSYADARRAIITTYYDVQS